MDGIEGLFRKLLVKKPLPVFIWITLLLFFGIYSYLSRNFLYFDTDIARDLYEVSNVWYNKVVWLGPRLSPGLHASPLYYYVLFPFVWLSGWNGFAIVLATTGIAVFSLGLFGYFAYMQHRVKGFISMILIGGSSWFISLAIHPGNGYTYALFLWISLTLLWYKKYFIVAAMFLGLAISYHPVAVFGIPFLLYEFWTRKRTLLYALLGSIVLVAPWTPIILFEIITKGYMIRSWMESTSTGIAFQLSVSNVVLMGEIVHIHWIILLVLYTVTAHFAKGRLKNWYLMSLVPFLFLFVTARFQFHYVFGFIILYWFIVLQFLMHHRKDILLVTGLTVYLLFGTLRQFIYADPPTRTIQKIEYVTQSLIMQQEIPKNKKIAVVAALDNDTRVPQADDYRFFLRMQGYTVLDPLQYDQAEILLMFIEADHFEWEKWSSWEIDQAKGEKQLFHTEINEVEVIGFSR